MMRGFSAKGGCASGAEAEYEEIEKTMREQADFLRGVVEAVKNESLPPEGLVRDLALLLPTVERLFSRRDDPSAWESVEHILASYGGNAADNLLLLKCAARECYGDVVLEHLLLAENTAHPERRAERERVAEATRHRAWQAAFHTAGLDGAGLLPLLEMKPGPSFGAILRRIQQYTRGEIRQLPDVSPHATIELERRVAHARSLL